MPLSRFALIFILASISQAQSLTTVTDLIHDGAGNGVTGSCTYQAATGRFLGAALDQIVGEPVKISFVNGIFTAQFVPTDTALPTGQYYSVSCVGTRGWRKSGNWIVATSATPLKLKDIWAPVPPPPGIMIPPAQLGQGGATPGQGLCWLGSIWGAGNCGGGAGAVSSVFGRTGIVVSASGDYTAAQVTNAVSTAGAYTDPSWLTLTAAGGRISGFALTAHLHTGVYEPVDITILRQANLAGSGSATTPARSDHTHTGVYAPLASPVFTGTVTVGISVPTVLGDGVSALSCPGQFASLTACLDAAKAFVTSAEDGTGKAIRIELAPGTFTLTSYPYILSSGMQIHGIMPRVAYLAGASPDDWMKRNGGTWIDCGGLQCLGGSALSGVILENLGFFNFTSKAFSFGGDNLQGIVQSRISNIWIQGGTAINSSNIGAEIYNPTHLRIDDLKVNYVNTGLRVVSQIAAWIPGNSDVYNLYVSTYPKSAANANNTCATAGIVMDSLASSGGAATPLLLMKFYGPQVTVQEGGDGTGYNVCAKNKVQSMSMSGADFEGPVTYAFYGATANDVHLGLLSSGTYPNRIAFDAASYGVLVTDPAGYATVTGAVYQTGISTPHLQNLVLQSQTLATAPWGNDYGLLAVTNNAAVGPDGTTTATSVLTTSSASNNYYFSQGATPIIGNGTYTFCVAAKVAVNTHRILIREGVATGAYAAYDISTGVMLLQSGGTGSITPLSNGWYQISLTVASLSGAPQWDLTYLPLTGTTFANATYTPAIGDGMYLTRAQMNGGTGCYQYLPTTTAAIK